MRRLSVRWTIGAVSDAGFEALHLSVWAAHRVFGDHVRYTVCVNTVGVRDACRRTGRLPEAVEWREVTIADMPGWARARVDDGMAQGVMWKLAPPAIDPAAHELALDNDCVLWAMPEGMARWLEDEDACLLAADVRPCFGRFAALCGPEPRNTGIRGTPPGFDLEGALSGALASVGGTLDSELDEQGMQVAALTRTAPTYVVRTDEVSICSPFPPHVPDLGTCGAHFVGLNAHSFGWSYEGRPAELHVREHFARHKPVLLALSGAPP